MKIKEGVKVTGLRPELLLALMVAKDVWQAEGQELVITSVIDGKHSATSLHYAGQAADLRIWGLADPAKTAALLNESLGEDYDVLAEGDHIHVEWQPRRVQQ